MSEWHRVAFFKNRSLRRVAETLWTVHHLAVASSAWTNGAVERLMWEITRTFKAVLNEGCSPVANWVRVVSIAQRAPTAPHRKRLATTPYKLVSGREPLSEFAVEVSGEVNKWQAESLSATRFHDLVAGLVTGQERLRVEVLDWVQRNLKRMRSVRAGVQPNVAVEEHVMVARFRKHGRTPKLVSTLKGPWRVASAAGQHLNAVEGHRNGAAAGSAHCENAPIR